MGVQTGASVLATNLTRAEGSEGATSEGLHAMTLQGREQASEADQPEVGAAGHSAALE